ncbi:CMRF35-like molecule 8 isoform X2 [Paramormyrops kingsleyae]|uniref:CMRF35-like molecule 8 isoform X2 n=1 Tax=Paramormyrops kingsleyae TaxID=1676925 RepID=UPI003B975969
MDPLMLLFLLIAGLTGADSVSTVSRVSAWRGGSVTIPCFYGDRYKTHVKYWCRGDYRDACTPIVHSDSPQEGKVSIRDDPDQRVFTLTINNLTAGDSGYYSCGVKISVDSDAGASLYLSVTNGSPELSVDKQEVTVVILGHDEDGGNTDKPRWEQVLDAVLKAGTGVLYLICTIIAIQLHWSSCRKRGSNQREAVGGANTNHRTHHPT